MGSAVIASRTAAVVPTPPDWVALVVGLVFFVVLPLSVWAVHRALAARRRKQAARRARDEALDYGELAGDEWTRWRYLSWSLNYGTTTAEPGGERTE